MSFFHQQFELEADGKKRVVQVWRQDHVITLRTSGTGTRAKQTEKHWPSQKAAVAELERLVAEYELAGYRATLDERGIKKKPELARHPGLEKSILTAPNDVDGYSVYADWLAEQGDPYGEFVACHCKLATDPKNKKLSKREDDLWNKHGQAWMAELWGLEKPPRKGMEPRLVIQDAFCGFLTSVTLREGAERLYPTLRKVRIGAFLRELGLHFQNLLGLDHIGRVLEKHGLPPGLELLGLVGTRYSTTGSLDLAKLLPLFGGLTTLIVSGHRIRLGKKIELPNLKSLTIASTRMKPEDLEPLAKAALPQLESLELIIGTEHHEPEVSLSDLEATLRGKGLARVPKVVISAPPGWHEAEVEALNRAPR